MSAERSESDREPSSAPADVANHAEEKAANSRQAEERPREIGGPKGPEPTRYGDWERGGRCIDF